MQKQQLKHGACGEQQRCAIRVPERKNQNVRILTGQQQMDRYFIQHPFNLVRVGLVISAQEAKEQASNKYSFFSLQHRHQERHLPYFSS